MTKEKSYGEQVYGSMVTRGLTANDLAQATGLDVSLIAKIIRNVAGQVDAETIATIDAVLRRR